LTRHIENPRDFERTPKKFKYVRCGFHIETYSSQYDNSSRGV
jgi:hypothetical protein